MKKKSIILAVVAMLMLAATACGQKTGENKAEDNKVQIETNNQVEVNNDKETDTSEETEAPTDAPEVTAEPEEGPDLSALITINGKEYDLSGDFQEVVGTMVRDGLKVCESNRGLLFDEHGKFGSVRVLGRDEVDIAANEYSQQSALGAATPDIMKEKGFLIRKSFFVDDMEAQKVVSGLGLASIKDAEENLDSLGFLKSDSKVGHCRGITDIRYDAVFVKGKLLDFSAYEDELEELKRKENSEAIGGILAESFPHMRGIGAGKLITDLFRSCQNYNDLKKMEAEHLNTSLDEELLLLFALEDAYKQLDDGKIERFTFVSFGSTGEEKTLSMAYSEYYLDKTWDQNKFINQ